MTRSWIGRLVLLLVVPVALVALWWWTSADSGSVYYPPSRASWRSCRRTGSSSRWAPTWCPAWDGSPPATLIAALTGIALGTLIGLAPGAPPACYGVPPLDPAAPAAAVRPRGRRPRQRIEDRADRSARCGRCCSTPSTACTASIPRRSTWPAASASAGACSSPRHPAGRQPQDRRRHAHVALGRPDSHGHQRDAGQHERPGVPGAERASAASTRRHLRRRHRDRGRGLVVNLGFLVAEGWIMRWHRGTRGLLEDTQRGRRPARGRGPGRDATTTPRDERRMVGTTGVME